MHWLSATREAVVTVAALTGAIVAVLGLNAWRRQLRGRTEYEVGLAVLRAAYKVRDAISVVRHPFMSSGEQASAMAELDQDTDDSPDEDPDERVNRSTAAAYQVRWQRVLDAMQELDVACVEAEVLWGKDATEPIRQLRKCVPELSVALSEYLREKQTRLTIHRPARDLEDVERIVFGISDDPFSGRVRAAVEAVEQFVRPKLK